MRRLLLFLAVLAVFALVACNQDQEQQCSCGTLHDHPGSPGGTTTSPTQSKIDGRAVVDGEGEAAISDVDPGDLGIYTRSPCEADGGDPPEDAGDGGSHWTETVLVHLGALPTDAGLDASIDLAEAGAYATALDPTTCAPVRILLTGRAVTTYPNGYDDAWHVSARTPRTNARAVVIEANVFHVSAKTSTYGPTPPSQECY